MPLHYAAARGSLEIVRLLLEHDAEAYSRGEDGQTPMHFVFFHARPKGDYPQIGTLLLEHGANPNARDNKRRTPLHLLSLRQYEIFSSEQPIQSWRLEVARILLVHGADVDAEDGEGRTPMQVAVENGQAELVHLLSEYCFK